MKLLLDVNVVIDLLADRAPFADSAAAVMARIETGAATGLLAAHTVTTVFYLSHEELLFRDAQHNKEVTSFEIFDLSRLVNILLVGDDHPVIGCSRRRELHL